MPHPSNHRFVLGVLLAGIGVVLAVPSIGLSQLFPEAPTLPPDEQLPARPIEADIHAPERVTHRIAVVGFGGAEPLASQGAEVLRNDLRYSSCCQVIDSRSFPRGFEQEGLGVRRTAWTGIGAQSVVKGEVRRQPNGRVELELRLYEVGQSDQPSLVRTYHGTEGELRELVHRFGNDVLAQLFGRPGAFDTQIVFSRRVGPGRKDVMLSDYDGADLRRVSSGEGVAMLPSFGTRSIWYSRLTQLGMYITNTAASERHIIESDGLNMGASVCGGRVYFTSTRDGNSEIYSAALDGTRVRRLTNDPAIDVSPTCGPDGRIAFVSNRHGGPQIFVMGANGSDPQRVTFRGYHNQTPSWCPDPRRPLLAFTGRDESMDIFTVNLNTQEYTRITQAQGINKDPAWSPDCRMLAFYSSRSGGGVYLSNPSGFNQNRVLDGHAETLRWSSRHTDR